jgi:hypothetical protein
MNQMNKNDERDGPDGEGLVDFPLRVSNEAPFFYLLP